MAVPSGPVSRRRRCSGRARARRRKATGRRAQCPSSPICSTRSRSRSSARGGGATAREFAAFRERDRLRSALLSSIGEDLHRRSPPSSPPPRASAQRYERSGAVGGGSEATKLERYLSNLLDMARIEAGAVKLRTEPVDLVDAVARGAQGFRASLGGQTVSSICPTTLPLVSADPQLLHHCLINLIDNARAILVPAAPSGSPAGRRGWGHANVEDEGPGLPLPRRHPGGVQPISGSDRKGGAGSASPS